MQMTNASIRQRWLRSFWLLLLVSGCEEPIPNLPEEELDASVQPVSYLCTAVDGGASCEAGFHCAEGQCVRDYCGDSIQNGNETCDDGNQRAGDGCSPSCRATPSTCGDAIVQDAEGEECDDGNWFNFDECSNDCTANVCGNQREDGYEECDDGNSIDNDACANNCLENRCRNGRLDPGEECDDGNQINDDGTWVYPENYSQLHRDTCSNACTIVLCGNGRIEGGEACDDNNSNHFDDCGNDCAGLGGCGNGLLETGEFCDGHKAQELCVDCDHFAADTACKQCREEKCRAIEDPDFLITYDLVSDCFENEDVVFAQECTALMDCMRTTRSGYGLAGTIESFCGTAPLGTCSMTNPGGVGGADGPCIDAFFKAAHTTNITVLTGSIGDRLLPVGIANLTMEWCDGPKGRCSQQCAPQVQP